MTTLVPRGYGGLPTFQFSPPNQINSRYYKNGYSRQGTSFAPHYPTQPLYQPPFNPVEGYPAPVINQYRPPGIAAQLVIFLNELDQQYRQEQYLRKLEKMQKQYWKQQANTMPPPMYPAPVPLNYSSGTVYQYEKETQYVPFPVYIRPSAGGYGARRNFGYAPGSSMTFGAGGGGGMSLPPKIRVIFIPTGQSYSQQPYTGSLAMPPFLYNRMSQPLCSFPLPPPLPQIASLPLTPAVQQMVIQRYSNPVAVLPYTPNWQMPQLMMSGYPSVPQQQQQYIPPVSAAPALPYPPQAYIPNPAPISAIPSFPPVPQVYISPHAPLLALPPLPPAPQAYIPPPPPPTMSANLSMLSPLSAQLPLPGANALLSSPQYSYSGYPSMCRACPPAPPPLNIPVTGHCWVQHCTACHRVPTPISNPNARPVGGRITPLLRQPTVPQYVPEQTKQQQQQYFHANAPVMMRPWLRKTPPIPPGGVVISDEYVDKNGAYSRYDHSQRQHRQYERGSRAKHRSTTAASKPMSVSNPRAVKNNRSVSPKRTSNNNNKPTQHQGSVKSKSTISASSSSTSSSGLSSEYQKLIIHPPKTKQNAIPQRLVREARNINLQYNYQPQELPTVYLVNRYLKSSSEASTLSSNVETRPDCSPPFVKKHSPFSSSSSSSSSSDSNSIKNEPNLEKEDSTPPRPPSHSKPSKEKLIIIREFMTSSPSTISTISSNMSFSIINKDQDSISTTSTLKADKLEKDDVVHRDIF